MTRVSTDDWVSISSFMGDYCWLMDDGLGDDWSALWEPEGEFVGIAPEPIRGREALAKVAFETMRQRGGNLRHLFGNLTARYDGDRDTVQARFYNYVSAWGEDAGNFTMALCEATFVRNGESWLIRRNAVRLLSPALPGLGAL